MLEIGEVVGGKLRIERVLGRGGMGTVVVATHLKLEQRVALKVLHEQLAADPATVERFMREARTPMRLRSDHVCRVLDVGQLDDGAPYIVMELLEGSDLAQMVKSRGPLPIGLACDYVLQACVAIAEAHALGIVHRDLKPANLYVTRRLDGSPLVKVLDFGIAKTPSRGDVQLTHTAVVMGSPGYMSPEQLRSARDVDARTDLWALGAILYELVSARLPFPADSVTELAVKVAVDPPAPLDVDPTFRAIVFRCLEKDPARRYQDVGELARELVPFASAGAAATAELIGKLLARTSATIPATPMGNVMPTRVTTLEGAAGQRKSAARRSRASLGIAAGAVAVLGVAVLGGYELAGRPSPSAPHDAAPIALPSPSPSPSPPPSPSPSPPADAAVVARRPRPPPPDARIATTAPRDSQAAIETSDDEFRSTARDLAIDGDWATLLERAEARLATDPDDPVALYYAVDAACFQRDAKTARKYAPKLKPKARHDLGISPCGDVNISLE